MFKKFFQMLSGLFEPGDGTALLLLSSLSSMMSPASVDAEDTDL
jgi:hypothetical protein